MLTAVCRRRRCRFSYGVQWCCEYVHAVCRNADIFGKSVSAPHIFPEWEVARIHPCASRQRQRTGNLRSFPYLVAGPGGLHLIASTSTASRGVPTAGKLCFRPHATGRKALSGGFRFPAARQGRSPPPCGTPPSPPSLGRVSRWRSSIPGPIPTSTFVPVRVSRQPECHGNLVHRWVWLFPHERTTARPFPQTENALHTSRIALVATRSGFHSVMAAMRFS